MKRICSMQAVMTALLCAAGCAVTIFSKTASDAAASALTVCLKCLIPSLFPYMIIASMLTDCGAAEKFGRICPAARLFRLPKSASGVIIMGALCGFPLGAKAAVDLYKTGALSKQETEALISVANNTGPSFVVAVIGAGLWKSAAFGWALYFIQLIGALISGIIINRIIFPLKRTEVCTAASYKLKSPAKSFNDAVCGAASAVLNVSGFVMIFAVIGAYIKPFCDMLSPLLTGAVFSVLELTGAAEYSASVAAVSASAGGFFAGFSLGFSGLSVFCQSAAFTMTEGLSLKRTFAVKALQGVICGALGAAAVLKYHPGTITAAFAALPIPSAICTAVLLLLSLKYMTKA